MPRREILLAEGDEVEVGHSVGAEYDLAVGFVVVERQEVAAVEEEQLRVFVAQKFDDAGSFRQSAEDGPRSVAGGKPAVHRRGECQGQGFVVPGCGSDKDSDQQQSHRQDKQQSFGHVNLSLG
ncbi:hypothetical protein K8R78_02390 [bacterium]|nr:hypothetical protein [bacterium]